MILLYDVQLFVLAERQAQWTYSDRVHRTYTIYPAESFIGVVHSMLLETECFMSGIFYPPSLAINLKYTLGTVALETQTPPPATDTM